MTTFFALAAATDQASACLQLPTEITIAGSVLEEKPVEIDGNEIHFFSGQGSVRISYRRISRKWCFERLNIRGGTEDSGCISETYGAGGEPMYLVKGQLKRSIPLRDADGNTYAELSFRGDRMVANLLSPDGKLGAQRLTFTDQSEGGRESVRVTSRLCEIGAQCEGASFTSARNAHMRERDLRDEARSYGPLNLSNSRADYYARSCHAPYAVLRRGQDFQLATRRSNTDGDR